MGRAVLVGMIVTALTLCISGCGATDGISPMTSEQAASTVMGQAASTAAEPVSTTGMAPLTTETTASAHLPPAPRVSFVAPRGDGEGRICYVEDQCGRWGPTGFCVLPDKSVAILGCGDQSIEVFSHTGEPLRSIDLAGVASSVVDIRWWNEAFAVLEFNSQPKSVILVDVGGNVQRTIDLWPGMDETMEGGLRIGKDGELALFEPCGSMHVLTDGQGDPLPPAQMRQASPLLAFRGGPKFEVAYQQEGPARVRAVGSSEWLPAGQDDASGGTPLASDELGNTYFRVDRVMYDSAGESVAAGDVVVKLDRTFRQVGHAPIDWRGLVMFPIRRIDITSDGNAYAMMPMADGVHVETLEFSADPPKPPAR